MIETEQTELLPFRCPHCGAVVNVKADLIGETVNCSNAKCQKPFYVQPPKGEPLDPKRARGSARRFQPVEGPAGEERVIEVVHRAMFRNHPIYYSAVMLLLLLGAAAFVWSFSSALIWNDRVILQESALMIVGAGMVLTSLVLFLIWWIQTRFITLTLTSERTIYRKGLISREVSEVRHDDVRNMAVDQSALQRVLGVGTIAISSSGQDDFEIRAHAVPRPEHIAELIRERQ